MLPHTGTHFVFGAFIIIIIIRRECGLKYKKDESGDVLGSKARAKAGVKGNDAG